MVLYCTVLLYTNKLSLSRRVLISCRIIQDDHVFVFLSFGCLSMVINVSVEYNGGFLPDILLLTQVLIFVWFDDNIILLLLLL